MKTIRQVAVLGAGTMGSRIAAHFANAGIPALLLDVTLAAAQKGIENALKLRPAGFFTNDGAKLVTPGSFDNDLSKIATADWILEAVTENLDIKRTLWDKVLKLAKPGAILSTNTSGIPLAKISEGWPLDARQRFLGTHFFNPPRYLHLLEIIPGVDTSRDVFDFVAAFGDRKLGKGIVPCKDTPNFIANRIGSFWGGTVAKITHEGGYTVEEVDYITGPLIGLPGTASFRLLDLVGLDIWGFVGENLYHAVPDDPWRDRFLADPAHKELMSRGWLGDKSGQGYYKKVGPAKEIHAINLKTFEYAPIQKVRFPSGEEAKQIEDIPARLRKLVAGTDRVGAFLWSLYSDLFIYCAERIPEISDRCVEIDRAMKWGYAHKYGPFELWDALGFEDVCKRLEAEGRTLPANILAMRQSGATSFYRNKQYFDLLTNAYKDLEERPGIVDLADFAIHTKNPGASLKDLGDGVGCVEFHSKLNSLGEDNFAMMQAGLDALEAGKLEALVIANQGQDFCVGANLAMVLLAAQDEEWDELALSIHRFQQLNMRLKYASRPVVGAPFGRTLGGGCEIQMHCPGVQAAAETYLGLVEVGVGVIPGGGGTKELLARLKDPRRCFETIGMAKVSASAPDAQSLGLLARDAGISMNTERLVADAKDLALSMISGYTPAQPKPIKVGGAPVKAMMKVGLWSMQQGGYISDYDVVVGKKLAHILSGGDLSGETEVSEQYLLDLEREAFLSLCGNQKTQERMAHMLKTGKPLRN
ncbi:putative 3-hydroxyacyl-CoA dehydrogenase [Bryobacterales bacterium F-183]|nr:putative 3-hydroxyacyl-CoA dehydrogenase [Bryobacterales bacterium F-183]